MRIRALMGDYCAGSGYLSATGARIISNLGGAPLPPVHVGDRGHAGCHPPQKVQLAALGRVSAQCRATAVLHSPQARSVTLHCPDRVILPYSGR